MSDVQGAAEPPSGGPSWMRRPGAATAGQPASAAPSDGWTPAAPAALPGPALVDGQLPFDAFGRGPERPAPLPHAYSRHAATPVPFAAAALLSITALLVAVRWATDGPVDGDRESLRTLNEVWFTVQNLLVPRLSDDVVRSPTKATVVLVLSGLVAATVMAWVGRLGRNLPLTDLTFGAGLAALGLPAWWTISLTVGMFDDPVTTRIDLVVRFAFAAGVLTIQYLLVRWSLLNRIWRAGRLPVDQASIVLWLPQMIPWMMFLCSSVFTVALTEEGEPPPDTWRPTPAMVDWGQALSTISAAAILLLLVVVTLRQQLGIAADRHADEAERARDRRVRSGVDAVEP